jgi:tetratricopeptide (TPR) repeat protein
MRTWWTGLLFLLALGHPSRADDAGNYGPDWPVCQNLNGDPQAEIAACQRLIDGGILSRQHLSWAYNDTGTAWIDLERGDLAGAAFQKSIEIDPTNHAPYYNLAALYLQARQFQEALDLYDKALALNPVAPAGAFCNRGKALEGLGRADDAFDSYQRELANAPNDDCALYRITKLAEDRHRTDIAMKALSHAIEVNPDDFESHHRRGTVYFDLGQYDQALADFSEAIRLNPREVGAMRSRALLYLALEEYPAALADLNQAIAIDPDNPDTYYNRAQVYLATADFRKAEADCQHRLELWPQDTACPGLQWRIAMMAGNYNAAAGHADTMIHARVQEYLLYRGAARFADGDLTKAAADFASYTQAVPNDPYGWLWLYLADRKLGKDDAADLKPLAARRDAWPTMVIRHIVGAATAEEVLASTDVPDPKIKRQRQAEANYYLGELASLAGDPVRAGELFRASLAAGRAKIDRAQFLPVYKFDDDLELALANAALHGKGL